MRSFCAKCSLALLTLAALACSPARQRLDKPHRSALWVGAGGAVTLAELGSLERVGVSELFVDAASLAWDGRTPRLEPRPLFSLPRRTGVTLVVRGVWPDGELDPAATATALAAEVASLLPQAEAQGLVPLGVHFDVAAGRTLASYGAVLSALQGELERDLFLSASMAREWIGVPGSAEVAGAVDFLVAFLYGQRPGESDHNASWDLQKVEANLDRLEELGRDYMLGVVTLGRAVHLGSGGEPLAETTRLSLGELARRPELELTYGFTLEGIDRLVYRFRVDEPVRAGEWSLPPGHSVRVTRLASAHVEELQRRLGVLRLDHLLGIAYYRLPAAGERLSLSLANLRAALAPEVAVAAPQIALQLLEEGRRRRRYRVVVANTNDEPTDIVLLGNNYAEVRVEGGSFGRVEPGGFHRWELLRPDRRGEMVRAFRNAPVLRLYLPFLDGSEEVASGPVEIVAAGDDEPVVSVGGSFVVPGGVTVEAVPAPEESEEEEAEAEAAEAASG